MCTVTKLICRRNGKGSNKSGFFFGHFGFPYQIFTDRGSNFESNLFKQLCERLHIYKARTTAFRPSANGQVERFNRTLMDAVRCFASRSPTHWDEYVPLTASAIRSSGNRSTGFTPNMLMLGREINGPVDLIFPGPEPSELQITYSLWQIWKKLKSSQNIAQRDYDLKTYTQSYSVGDPVYILDTSTPKGKCSKLRPKWKGPGLIVRKITDYLYKVMLRKRLETINHDRMKPCRDKNLPVWLTKQKTILEENTNTVRCPSEMTKKKSLFCLCRGPDDGTFMIQCQECREWYHGSCVNVTPEKADQIDDYLCPDSV
jgi:hypothetical protein